MPKKFFLRDFEFLVFDSVYCPAEDSELLADAVKVFPGSSVLDMGCGTGIQGLNAVLQGASFACFADKNPAAVQNAEKNFGLLKKQGACGEAGAEFFETDLFSGISRKFDLILFNPPYVPSGKKKFLDLDGGEFGREVLDGFLEKAPGFLNPNGRIFFLQTSINIVSRTKRILKEKGFRSRIAARQKLFFEELFVFKAWKKKFC
ncbi:MAG: methyltransferase [Candidatus ainarchaeum sp.]|nr:methyltransferase [Candidatus ainarchaeum sp.]